MMEESINKKNYKLINIVTLYENEDEVLRYAVEFSKQLMADKLCLIIVINKQGKRDFNDFENALRSLNINYFIYKPNNNLGYLNGLLFGYKSYRNKHSIPEWVVMSNTDLKFKDSHFFETFLITKYEDNVWNVGPSIYSEKNNTYENPYLLKRYSVKALNRRIFIFQRPKIAHYYYKLSLLKNKLSKRKKIESCYVYSLHGSFFIIRGEFAELLKNKKFNSLMYGEEIYISEILRNSRKKSYYDSQLEILHEGSTVTNKLEIEKKSRYQVESLRFLKEEFY